MFTLYAFVKYFISVQELKSQLKFVVICNFDRFLNEIRDMEVCLFRAGCELATWQKILDSGMILQRISF